MHLVRIDLVALQHVLHKRTTSIDHKLADTHANVSVEDGCLLACYSHSCNHDKGQYSDKCGNGRIQRDDRAIRLNTDEAMMYLVKDDQHLRLRPEGARCLRRGTLSRLRRC